MWQELIIAACLVLVIEGMLPFLTPTKWRQLLISVLTLSDGQIRMVGLTSMALGVFLLLIFN